MKLGFFSSGVVIMNGCDVFGIVTLHDTIRVVHKDLFPKAKELNIDTADYMKIVFNHSRITQEDKDFLKNGVKWLNEEALLLFKTTYIKLSDLNRQKVLQSIAKTDWGESWIRYMMQYILEATLGDPIYRGDKNEAAWKWLAYEGGKPSPKKVYL
ncbi:gluconate 2-dehydrogenase subunit 3 family protein [Sulfurimonas aquatica]|nr:gluconate 2-dehydrogenase subunit 3 family protein [Sulfurimonas aquatica]